MISAIAEKSAKIAGEEYTVTGSSINLDTSVISVTLNQELPAGVKLEVCLIADFDARDTSNRRTTPAVMVLPSASSPTTDQSLSAGHPTTVLANGRST